MRWRSFMLVLAACEVVAALVVGNELMGSLSDVGLGTVVDAVASLDLNRILSLLFG